MKELPSWYEFHEWEKAFEDFKELWSRKKKIRMVIPTHYYTSGYWIEEIRETLTVSDYVYDTYEKIMDLAIRVRHEIESAKIQNRGVNLIV